MVTLAHSDVQLACPRTHAALTADDTLLRAGDDTAYRLVRGVPVMLRGDVTQSQREGEASLAADDSDAPTWMDEAVDGVHPHVQRFIVETGGSLYRDLVGRLDRYPIPHFPLTSHSGETLLDIGCNWGRWSLAAAQAGFKSVGLDPNLEAVEVARHVSNAMGLAPDFVVGDARYLPFPDAQFDVVFSYSVLQHLPKEHVCQSLDDIARVLKPGGRAYIQLANKLGPLGLFHQGRRKFRAARGFEVRYWTPKEMVSAFERAIGPAELHFDGIFTINPQTSDRDLLSPTSRAVLDVSETVKRASKKVGALRWIADSLYVSAVKH